MTISRHKHFEQSLRNAASNWFNARGYTKGSYILPRWEDWPRNIILPEVAEYIENERKLREAARERFPLHKWIHHGLSSQAMLFNLVGPLIVRRDLAPLREAFVRSGVEWQEGPVAAHFEYENPGVFGEYGGQPTSMDLVIGVDGATPRIFVEAKLVEREFGGCSLFSGADCDGRNPSKDFGLCYLHGKKKRRYWEVLERHGFLSGPVGSDSMCVLAVHYQFFRGLLLAVELGGTYVLLHDRRSPVFHAGKDPDRGLVPLLLGYVPEPLRGKMVTVAIQDVVAAFREHEGHGWLRDFVEKYGLE